MFGIKKTTKWIQEQTIFRKYNKMILGSHYLLVKIQNFVGIDLLLSILIVNMSQPFENYAMGIH